MATATKIDTHAEPSPLVKQYYRIKAEHPDHVVFFRCGDFYEMFNEDAKLASQVLGIALTKRGTNGRGEPMPLAGVPYHSVEPYLAKFIRAGYKVAICEQMENPKNAKGVVRREVVRVVTPGTVLEDNLLDNKSNNYLVGLVQQGGDFGLAALDYSTGQFMITEFSGSDARQNCANELARINPAEVVLARGQIEELTGAFGWTHSIQTKMFSATSVAEPMQDQPIPKNEGGPTIAFVEDGAFSHYAAREMLLRQMGVRDLNGFGAEDKKLAVCAAGAVLEYLRETQRQQLPHITELRVYNPSQYMTLDPTTQRSLELVSNLTDATKRNTLLEVLDESCTSMGGRTLRSWILQPLRSREQIEARLGAVEALARNHPARGQLCDRLKQVHDLERIISRASCKTANARDLLALKNSLQQLPHTREVLLAERGVASVSPLLNDLCVRLDPLEEIASELDRAIVESPPMTVREGGMIRTGYNERLDELKLVTTDSKSWIASMRQQEVERTGISNLKIGFNRVFGYYIEISNSHLAKIPPEYIRKQTLVGAERFITPELKEKEEVILHAEERIQELEFELFEKLREKVCEHTRQVQSTGRAVAELDALLSLAQCAVRRNFCRPRLNEDGNIRVLDGRHAVIEALDFDQPFVPNDTLLDTNENQILLITGPNMAGKSTYIRQVALITLLAHMGSFVPAREAEVALVDRIFTRVGAMDQLAKGQSTFLVEMSETANILNNATDESLVILDEIGRGTSTYDGLSIAWSVIEFLHNTAGKRPKTLFATHYHELVDLEGPLGRLKNYSVAVLEEADKIAFLYKIVRGSTDRSYGIYAAQVAGLPRSAVQRAKEILAELELGNSIEVAASKERATRIQERVVQLTLFDAAEHPVLKDLRELDCNKLTPLDALALLSRLCAEAKQ